MTDRLSLGIMLLVGAASLACAHTSTTGITTPPDTSTTNQQTPPDTITVSGQVVDGILQPLGGVPVLIAGREPVTTDAEGRFTVSGVEKPYDVATALNAPRLGVLYTGLTRGDPLLMISITNLVTPQTYYANLSGTISGGAGFPASTPQQTAVWFESPEATLGAGADAWTGAYQMTQLQWRGPSTITGTVHALQVQYDQTTHAPGAYNGYGTRTGVTISSGTTISGQDVQLSAVSTLTVSGTVTVPSGETLFRKTLRAGFGPTPSAPPLWSVGGHSDSASTFSYLAPSLPGAALTLYVATAGLSASGVVTVTSANADHLSLVLPPRPELVAPPDGATNLAAGASLTWRSVSGAIYMIVIYEPSASNSLRYHLLTADTTAVIPDLSALNLALSSGTSYAWSVYAVAPFTDLDEAAGSAGLFLPNDWTSAFSVERHFTTAP